MALRSAQQSPSDGDSNDNDTASSAASATNLEGISPMLHQSIIETCAKYFDNVSPHQFKILLLRQHKPLGCTAEESLNPEENGTKHIFVSKVVEDGNANQNGILIGDVIVGVSGAFQDVVNVVESDLDRIRSLIAGKPPDEVLTLVVLRGSDVLDKHEATLLDLCLLPEGQGKDIAVEQCIETLYKADYDFGNGETSINDNNVCDDDDTECMIDSMFDMWESEMDELRDVVQQKEGEDDTKEIKKPAPWSSRSSPSGTFVRDPKTGKMVNIDE